MKIQNMSESAPSWRPSQAEVANFLNTQHLGVISTIGPDGPQGATVAFSQTDALEIIIGTSDVSRKALNIDNDHRVAFTITDPEQRFTVQTEGYARELGQTAFGAYAEKHFEKLPNSAPFRDIKGQAYFLLSPRHVRFTDCNPHPWVITEFDFE